MPIASSRVGVLIHPQVSLGLAFLARDLYRRTNRLLGKPDRFHVSLVGFKTLRSGPLLLAPARPRGKFEILIVPPFEDGFDGDLGQLQREIDFIAHEKKRGCRIGTACLGAFLAAEAGILDGVEATTHWRWIEQARDRYPLVKWRPQNIICPEGNIVTAGGYLALVDLVLHFIGQDAGRDVMRELGRRILADTTRQKQSVYAQQFTFPPGVSSPFAKVDELVDRGLRQGLSVGDLADATHTSLRTFHRRFLQHYGVTPRKYIQLKRIERAQQLLRGKELSLEQILERVGVSDLTSFRRVFERETGLSPSRFRKTFQAFARLIPPITGAEHLSSNRQNAGQRQRKRFR